MGNYQPWLAPSLSGEVLNTPFVIESADKRIPNGSHLNTNEPTARWYHLIDAKHNPSLFHPCLSFWYVKTNYDIRSIKLETSTDETRALTPSCWRTANEGQDACDFTLA
uniref:Uncharacterized protein n=1 Tax=Opuntia streptacantha TaxID=393608 RepID=A0A7C9DJ21_OPUST